MRRTEALALVKFYQILSIFIFFIRLMILEDFVRLISYNGPCVRLGCSFYLATALNSNCLYLNEDHTLVEIEGSWITGLTIDNSHRGKTHYLFRGTFMWCHRLLAFARSRSLSPVRDFRV